MKRLYIERFYLNRADDEYPMTVRIILQMKDDVDGHLLEEAVAATQTRYPYLCVKLGVERDADGSEHYVYHDNPRPWKVTDSRQPVCLCSEEANEHLMAFAWWDDCVALDFFHALIDGTAAYRILRTLFYEYCRRRYDCSREVIEQGAEMLGWPLDEVLQKTLDAMRDCETRVASEMVKQPSKDMYRVRRTAVRPIGMAMA